jgi:tetratricopeptide (TPR) repeat protein
VRSKVDAGSRRQLRASRVTSNFALRPSHFLAAALLFALTAVPLSAQRGSLTGAAPIARVYDAIFDAQFERVPGLLTQACPPAPADVCALLDVVSLWWQIQLDPESRSRDSRFTARADAVVAGMEAWTRREPDRAEAWFYLGGAYGVRAQWRVLRGETIAAARDGKRIKDALERSLALDPGLQDAYFGIGLYHYYADVAPAAAKVLRFLLSLPGGDKVEGMKEMLRARSGGQLLRDEADYQLHVIDLWYEKQPQHALALLRGLRERHPRNPHFPEQIARIEEVYLHDHAASLQSWRTLLDAAEAGRVAMPDMAMTAARLALAPEADARFETDIAVAWLQQIVATAQPAPFGAVQRAQQMLRRFRGRLDAPNDTARAYRLSLEGWRAYEHGALIDAARLLNQAVALRPKDTVARYRLARVLDAQNNDDAAVEMYESVLLAFTTTPPAFYAYASLDAARLYEQRGEIPRAAELYRRARSIFGADSATIDASSRALARLGL